MGIQDVHNLAWKLAGCLHGWANALLLETYEAERRPFALAVNDDVAQNLASAATRVRTEQFSNRGRVLGVSYDSTAIVPDGTDLPAVANPVIEYVPTARPGSRAPHMWLRQDGQKISALDLFDTHVVLLTGPDGHAWRIAGEQAAEQLGIPIHCYAVGPDGPLVDKAGAWPGLYGVGPDGAVLVRPDGYVAWRNRQGSDSPAVTLDHALRRVVGREM